MQTKKDMRNDKSLSRIIGEGALFYLGDSLLGRFLSLLSVFILIHYLGVFEYGLWILSKSIFDIFNSFLGMGIGPTILADMNIERGKKEFAKFKAIFLDFVMFKFILAIVLWFFVFISVDIFSKFYTNATFPYIKSFSFLLLLSPFKSTISIFFKSHLKFNYIVYYSIIEKFLYTLLLIIFIYLLDFGVQGAIYSLFFSTLIAMVVLMPAFIKSFAYLTRIRRTTGNFLWRIIKKHGKWAILSNYVSAIDKNINSWLIAYFLGVENVAIFSVAKSLLSHLSSLVPINKVISPIFSLEIENRSKVAEMFFRSFKYTFYIFALFIIMAYLFVPLFIKLFFPQYLLSIPLFNIILISLLVSSFAVMLNPLFNALRRQKELFYYLLIKFIVSIVLVVFLIYYFGLMGAAINFVIIAFIFTIIRYWGLKKIMPEIKINFKNLFIFDNLDKILLVKILSRFRIRY